MNKQIWLTEEDFRRLVPVSREGRMEGRTSFWHRRPDGSVLGPRVAG